MLDVVIAYNYFSAFTALNTVYITMGVGGVLFLIGLLGCFASFQTKRRHYGFLWIYTFFVLLAFAAQIASTVLVAEYAGYIQTQNSVISSGLTNSIDISLNDAILSSYTACCIGCPSGMSPRCTDPQPFYNKSLDFCISGNVSVCAPVQICPSNNPNVAGCFVETSNYPPIQIDPGICTIFESLTNGSVPIVGSAITGACGGGNPVTYQHSVSAYFSSKVVYVIIGFSVLAALQGINLFLSVCALCFEKRPKRKA